MCYGGFREAAMKPNAADTPAGHRTERRISWLTLLIGLLAGLLVGVLRNPMWGVGLGIGTLLALLNFRWLRRGLNTLVQASEAQADAEKPRVPIRSYFGMLFRYGLIAFAVYVIFEFLRIPVLSMIVGLCALGAATIAASVYEVLRPVE
jgi:small-conductance mechanosensitive channel